MKGSFVNMCMKSLFIFKKYIIDVSILVIFFALLIVLFPNNILAELPNKVVKVTGYGDNINEARNDAIRQALQETMQQLIVVDRAIKDDQIIRDKIMSTMNGYIENFKELSIKKEGEQIAVTAEITISPSRIENFIGTNIGGSGSVSGAALFADVERERAQRKVRAEIFDRLFRGFPSEVTDVKLLKLSTSKDLKYYILDVEISFSKTWVDALKSGVKAISSGRCTGNERGKRTNGNNAAKDGEGQFKFKYGNETTDCYVLPPAEYGIHIQKSIYQQANKKVDRLEDYENSQFVIAVQFIDERGLSVGINKKCLDFLNQKDRRLITKDFSLRYGFFSLWLNHDRGIVTIDTKPMIKHIKIPVDQINVSIAKNVVFLPYVNLNDNHSIILDVMAEDDHIMDICDEPMDRVVRRVMMQPNTNVAEQNVMRQTNSNSVTDNNREKPLSTNTRGLPSIFKKKFKITIE